MSYHTFTIDVGEIDPIEVRDDLIGVDFNRVIFDLDKIICEKQVRVALFRANRAFDQGNQIANTWGIEVLLHLAANHQISTAIDLLGVTNTTSRIGVVQQSDDKPHPTANPGLVIDKPTDDLLELYKIDDDDPCMDIITKGVNVILDHE